MKSKTFLIFTFLLVISLLISCDSDRQKAYIVNFNSNGGSYVEALMVKEGSYCTKPETPTKEGSDFRGWYKSDGSLFSFESETVSSNITLKAEWSVVATYVTVFFDSDGGSEVKSQTVEKGGKVKKPEDPTYKDYIFSGWLKLEEDGYTYFDFDTDTVTEDIVLYADWQAESATQYYTVTFDSAGGSAVTSEVVAKGAKVKKPDAPVRAGYDFENWIRSDTNSIFDFEKDTVSSNITLKALWKENYGIYTVTFVYGNGTDNFTTTVKKWDKLTKPDDPKKDGEYFVYWTKENNTAFDFDIETVSSDMKLTAVWSKDEYYTVKFNTDGGSYVASQMVKKGEKVRKPDPPTKDSYAFQGWVDDSSREYDFSTPVESDKTLSARWTLNGFEVAFYLNGEPYYNEKIVAGGKAYRPKTTPTSKEQYKTFKCWALGGKEYDFNASVTQNIKLVAQWRDYEVGDIGPEGGYIFYDVDADNESGNKDGLKSSECGWRYLEAAKDDISSPVEWGCFSSDNYGTKYGIGEGKKNTELLLENRNRQYPPMSDYVWKKNINGKDDWYIPSKDELNLMYENLQKKGLGNFRKDNYWASSENNDVTGDARKFNAWSQNFSDGKQESVKRNSYNYIRPVRQL